MSFRIVKKDNGYRFELIPRNKHKIDPLGVSPVYETREACQEAQEAFRLLIREKQIDKVIKPWVKVEAFISEERNIKMYRFYYHNDNGECVLEREKPYWHERDCIDGIERIYNAVLDD